LEVSMTPHTQHAQLNFMIFPPKQLYFCVSYFGNGTQIY
jgi:hypothetical protein